MGTSNYQNSGHNNLQVITNRGDREATSLSTQELETVGHPQHLSEAGSRDNLLSNNTHCCPPFLRCRAIVFYTVVVCLVVVLSLPTILYFLPISALDTEENVPTANISNFTALSPSSTNCSITCREDFFCKEGTNRCVPNCGTFKAEPTALSVFSRLSAIVLSCIGIIGSLLVIVISCIRWKKVLSFPSVFIVYLMSSILLFYAFTLIGSVGQQNAFCSSEDLLESVLNSTSFCIVFGVTRGYASLQAAIWWMFHAIFSWWKIQFPFRFRDHEEYHKYIHLGCVLLGLVLPAIASLITLVLGARDDMRADTHRYGYSLATFPPIECFPYRNDVAFYTEVVPVNIFLVIGLPFLLLLFWLIYKHKNSRYKLDQKKRSNKKKTQKKLLVMFCYYFTIALLVGIFISFSSRSGEKISDELNLHFLCESNGMNPNDLCDRSQFERLTIPLAALRVTSTILLGCFPLVSLIYVLDIKDLKKVLKSCFFTSKLKQMTIETSTCSQQPH